MKSGTWVPAFVIVLVWGLGLFVYRSQPSTAEMPAEIKSAEKVEVVLPRLSAQAAKGEKVFYEHCAVCHGVNAVGTAKGPPLIHKIYETSHHGDISFERAVKFGVRQHHWPFGDMPPQPKVTEEDTALVIRFIRDLQEANGIF